MTFTGSGFLPGENVKGTVHSDPVDLGVSVADANGNVSFTWNVPANFATGEHTVILTGETSTRQVEAIFTVLAAGGASTTAAATAATSATTSAPAKGELATTGSATTALWGAALLMALLGAGIVLGNRRRAGLHK